MSSYYNSLSHLKLHWKPLCIFLYDTKFVTGCSFNEFLTTWTFESRKIHIEKTRKISGMLNVTAAFLRVKVFIITYYNGIEWGFLFFFFAYSKVKFNFAKSQKKYNNILYYIGLFYWFSQFITHSKLFVLKLSLKTVSYTHLTLPTILRV